jgi:hypothetical protein
MDEEHWRPFEGRYHDGLPLIGAISRLSEHSETQSIEFPWCIHIIVHFDDADDLGYPTKDEGREIDRFSESLLARLRAIGTVIEAVRLTGHGAREFWWFVREPDPMHDLLTEIAERPELYRSFDYEITFDVDWEVLDRFSGRNTAGYE